MKFDIDIANKLFPNWATMVATIIAFLILMLVLVKLVYQPVKRMYQKRQKYIQDNINQSKHQIEESNLQKIKATQELLEARHIAQNIIDNANKEAEQIKLQSIGEAKDQAQLILDQSKKTIKQSKIDFYSDFQKTLVNLAIEISQKIIEKEIDVKVHKKLIEDYIGK